MKLSILMMILISLNALAMADPYFIPASRKRDEMKPIKEKSLPPLHELERQAQEETPQKNRTKKKHN